jgi:hypothetical protein
MPCAVTRAINRLIHLANYRIPVLEVAIVNARHHAQPSRLVVQEELANAPVAATGCPVPLYAGWGAAPVHRAADRDAVLIKGSAALCSIVNACSSSLVSESRCNVKMWQNQLA